MSRIERKRELISGRVTEFNPGRGTQYTVPYTQTVAPLEITATHTLMSLVGPGVVELAIFNCSAQSGLKFRMHIDGYDLSVSASIPASNYHDNGLLGWQDVYNTRFERTPFNESFKVVVSRPTALTSTLNFRTAYRLIEA